MTRGEFIEIVLACVNEKTNRQVESVVLREADFVFDPALEDNDIEQVRIAVRVFSCGAEAFSAVAAGLRKWLNAEALSKLRVQR